MRYYIEPTPGIRLYRWMIFILMVLFFVVVFRRI